MAEDTGFLNRLRSRGQEYLTQVSAELSQNPRFMQAVAGAMRGKERLEEAVGRVVRQMNVPTRTELKRATARIDALEKELAALKRSRSKAAPVRARARRPRSRGKAAG
jgi:polyhydroxyalkanoate synthesis regulator phasin